MWLLSRLPGLVDILGYPKDVGLFALGPGLRQPDGVVGGGRSEMVHLKMRSEFSSAVSQEAPFLLRCRAHTPSVVAALMFWLAG